VGDVNGDHFADIIAGAGSGGQVKVWSGRDGAELASFQAVSPGHRRGIHVAAGDLDGDGRAEVIVGIGGKKGGQVRVLDGLDGEEWRRFTAFPGSSYRGGVSVAAGDVDGDGRAEIIAGQSWRRGGMAVFHVGEDSIIQTQRIKSGDGSARRGVEIAAGDVTGDGRAELVAVTRAGGNPLVQVFDLQQRREMLRFPASDFSSREPIGITMVDTNADQIAEIIASAATDDGHVRVRVFDSSTGGVLREAVVA
jgi:WD40 repeat protein